MLQIQNVTKKYHKTIAVDHVSLTAPDQCISVLVGPNGAGKSTLIKSIMGLLRYEGEITHNGISVKEPKARETMAYVPEVPDVYNLLTVDEHLEFIARLYKIDQWKEKAEALLERFELIDKRRKMGHELSKGMKQKVSICCGLLSEPTLILFDEPMMGLDPHAIKKLKETFFELKERGASIIISTHILDSVEDLWDQAFILQNGTLRAALQKSDLPADCPNLESYFFKITEGIKDHEMSMEPIENITNGIAPSNM